MTVQVELWQLVTLLLSFLGFLFAAGRLLLSQIDRRLSDRFSAMEKAREEGGKHWDERFTALQEQARRDGDRMTDLERTVLKFQAELPMHYVRREDYIRGQSVIEAKLDGLASKIEAAQLRGLLQGGRNVS